MSGHGCEAADSCVLDDVCPHFTTCQTVDDGPLVVYLLSRWASHADHREYGPLAFASFEAARAEVAKETGDQRGWFQHSPGRALRWRDPKDHERGFWEILTTPVR